MKLDCSIYDVLKQRSNKNTGLGFNDHVNITYHCNVDLLFSMACFDFSFNQQAFVFLILNRQSSKYLRNIYNNCFIIFTNERKFYELKPNTTRPVCRRLLLSQHKFPSHQKVQPQFGKIPSSRRIDSK